MLRKFSIFLLPCAVLAVLVAGALAVTPSTDSVTEEETSSLVERTFVVPVGTGVEGPPRWESEDSLLLVVNKGGRPGGISSIDFADDSPVIAGIETAGKTFDCDLNEASVTHVTTGGPGPWYAHWWGREVENVPDNFPPPGSQCATGPNGNVIKSAACWAYQSGGIGPWVAHPDYGTMRIWIGVGLFTK